MEQNKILILLLLFLVPISNAHGQNEPTKTDYILNVHTENSKYLTGQVPVIFGTIYDNNGNPLTTKINLSVYIDKEFPEYESSILAKDGKFRHVGFSSDKVGEYFISATIDGNTIAITKISFNEFYQTKLGIGIIVTIVPIVALLVLIGINPRKWPVTAAEPSRFALLSLCSLIPIISLIAADVQLGQDGVAGLVLQEISKDSLSPNLQNINFSSLDSIEIMHFNWVMHFGGNVFDNYQSGIVVPVYVLFFGMIGGYLRFLYKTQRGWFINRAMYEIKRTDIEMTENELRHKANEEFTKADANSENTPIGKRIIFNNSMEDLSLIFLPPILAVASYFLLLQGGLNPIEGWPTFAVVSFAIGLISNEIIHKLESFAHSTLNDSEKNVTSKSSDNALKTRFAKGEITKEEYEEMKKTLES